MEIVKVRYTSFGSDSQKEAIYIPHYVQICKDCQKK